jgi:hypothetical protein
LILGEGAHDPHPLPRLLKVVALVDREDAQT